MPKPYVPNPVVTQNLAALMRARDVYSQPALAAKSGVQQTTIGRILRGAASPMADTLKLMAEALDCDMGLLYLPPEQFQELLESGRSMRFDISALGGGGPAGTFDLVGTGALVDDSFVVRKFLPEERVRIQTGFDDPVYGLRVRGDGGAPVLKAGQILVLQDDGPLQPGDLAVFTFTNGAALLKELLYEQAGIFATASVTNGARATLEKSEIEKTSVVVAVLPASWAARKEL